MSKPDAWMPLWIGDYLGATQRLTLAQHGAYLLLIMDYWRNGPPPDDNRVLARILSIGLSEWLRLRPALVPMFQVGEGQWRHKRVEAELTAARQRSDKAVAKARLAANQRWGRRFGPGDDASSNAPGIPQAMHMQCPSPSPNSVPTERADASPEDPNKEAWRRGPALIARAGGASKANAKGLFGKLLKEHGLEGRDLLPAIVRAEGSGTADPQGYLTAAARALARRSGGPLTVDVAEWDDDVWAVALANYQGDGAWAQTMGPRPGEPGCRAPPHLLLRAAQ